MLSSGVSGGGSGNPSVRPAEAALENPSRASMVFSTAQLYAASPGGTTRKMYVLSVNLPRKMLNCGVFVCMTTKPADAGVVLVLRAAQCLNAFIIFDRRSWRSKIGFKSPISEVTEVTVKKVDRSNRMTSSASIFFANAERNRSMTVKFGMSL